MKQYEILHCNGLVVFSTKPTLVLKEAADFMFSMKQPWLFLCKPAVPGLEVPEPGNTPPVCLLFTTLSSLDMLIQNPADVSGRFRLGRSKT
jgi:hypothetical protein